MRGFLIALLLATAPAALVAKDKPLPDSTRWAFETSDVPVDPEFRFGRLDNGLRYVIRHNALPAGTVVVRMDVAAGSLDESDGERGFAHFVEHMAFNGSTRIPEGQMVPLLEREGLAFGADTNASTNFDRTLYKLDLPRNDPALVDTALMLMRETASNLTISQDAVERERGVIFAEMRDRNSWALRNTMAGTAFFYPRSRYAERFPIGTTQALTQATAASLRAFYQREYVPGHVTLVVVGDIDPAAVEAGIVRHFNDWAAPPPEKQPGAGPVRRHDADRVEVYLDPALAERVTVQRNDKWRDEPDSVTQRREAMLRAIGYDIVNRRLARLARSAEPPFRGAGFGTGDVFEAGRSTRLIVDAVDGQWQAGLRAAVLEYRRALKSGFTDAEVAEQVAQVRTALVNAAGSSRTRSNLALAQLALGLIDDEMVPSTPQSGLDRFEAFAPQITPQAVLAALKREAVPLKRPLIRFQGRKAPAGGAAAIRQAWRQAMSEDIASEAAAAPAQFAYTDFGTPGTVASDRIDPALGIREVRFANGLMLNLKRTDLEQDRIRLSLALDGGDMLDTRTDPLATDMVGYLDEGGLGKHSLDELETILAGRTVSFGLTSGEDTFSTRLATTPRDLDLQLQVIAAFLTDPGYRPEGEVQYSQQVNNYFAQLRATPGSALQADLGAILSGNDPRFSLQPVDAYRQLTYARLRKAIGDRLAHGALELALVGDIDEDKAIALVAATLGALPARETVFSTWPGQPPRRFTSDRAPRVIHHQGPADQALLRITWPTRDDADPQATLVLELLERVMRIELTEQLREALGKAYSPFAGSSQSRSWAGWGTFAVTASVDVADVAATRAAIRQVVTDLRTSPVSDDILKRARQPLLESLQNALKTNAGWMGLTARAQTEPDVIARFQMAKPRLEALTAADVQAAARQYLAPEAGLEVTVLPEAK